MQYLPNEIIYHIEQFIPKLCVFYVPREITHNCNKLAPVNQVIANYKHPDEYDKSHIIADEFNRGEIYVPDILY